MLFRSSFLRERSEKDVKSLDAQDSLRFWNDPASVAEQIEGHGIIELNDMTLNGADLLRSVLSDPRFPEITFRNCKFFQCTVYGPTEKPLRLRLSRSFLHQCLIENTQVELHGMYYTTFNKCSINKSKIYISGILKRSTFRDCRFSFSFFGKEGNIELLRKYQVWRFVDFRQCRFEHVIFWKNRLKGCHFEQCDGLPSFHNCLMRDIVT